MIFAQEITILLVYNPRQIIGVVEKAYTFELFFLKGYVDCIWVDIF